MAEYLRCDWCGRTYKKRSLGSILVGDSGLAGGIGKGIDVAARLGGKRNFCGKECKLAYKQSKGGGNRGSSSRSVDYDEDDSVSRGNGGGSSTGAALFAKGASALFNMYTAPLKAFSKYSDEKKAEKKEKKAELADTIAEIKDTEFDAENQQNFVRQFIGMCEDFKACNEKEVKAAYKARLQKEFSIISATAPELAEKVKSFWEPIQEA